MTPRRAIGISTLWLLFFQGGAGVNISRKYFEVEGFSDADVQFMVTEEPTHGALVLLRPDGTAAPLTGGRITIYVVALGTLIMRVLPWM